MIRAGYGTGHFLQSKEGVNQRDPLSMITYVLRILLLTWDLRVSHPRVTQPWYDNGDGAVGPFVGIRRHLDNFMVQGAPQGYSPDPTKNILVVSLRNVL